MTQAMTQAWAQGFGEPGPAQPATGRMLAERLCANCHVVSRDATGTAIAGVPTFPAIAAHPGQTAERLAGIIIVPHPPMPAIQLTRDEARNIIAYILSLRSGG